MATNQKLTVVRFEEHAAHTDQLEEDDASSPFLGLVGEVGSLLSALKKKNRDTDAFLGYHDVVVEELGDVLWYISAVARRGGTSLHEVLLRIAPKTSHQLELTFDGIESSRVPISAKSFEMFLLQLAGEAGDLAKRFSEGVYRSNPDSLRGDLVKLVRPLLDAAVAAEVGLGEAATVNMGKTEDRWPITRNYPALVDERLHEDEKLPRKLRVLVYERDVGGTKFVFQKVGAVLVGDRLTDNHSPPDDYRFHDVFHLAHAAILGWSPTTRALLRTKRKSQKEIDENEDGARANLIEEGLTTWIFEIAKRHNFFASTPKLGFDLLKSVKQFVRGYEAEKIPMWMWESAILQGYAAFRVLRDRRHGAIMLDAHQRKIWIEEMTHEERKVCGLDFVA